MSPTPAKLDAATAKARLVEVAKAHGSIHHHATEHATGSYQAIAERVKAEQPKPAPK